MLSESVMEWVEYVRHSCYDVSLDSAADGPDTLAVELNLVRNMKLAVNEEQYNDAAMWRDKLTDLRTRMDLDDNFIRLSQKLSQRRQHSEGILGFMRRRSGIGILSPSPHNA
ncbi:hypothetical protein RJ641_010741 [Dillenia turbinata]|uniref:UVR domain-containing protein n=1 Tax=Dillenia turbinata TaxID=194707 RepID=A0AAN8Z4K4_9MAGN